jgi:hypothetical protein
VSEDFAGMKEYLKNEEAMFCGKGPMKKILP